MPSHSYETLFLKHILIVVCFLTLTGSSLSQPVNPVFKSFTTENGLPQNTINVIHQDRMGFMWFGTQDGLVRFDGYTFKTFSNDPGQPNSLKNNYIWDIVEDESGNLWINSFGGGLTRFSTEDEYFYHYERDANNPNTLSHNNTFSSVFTDDGLWVTTDDGLCKVTIKTDTIERFLESENNHDGQAGNYLDKLAFQKPNVLWMSNHEGLVSFNIETEESHIYESVPFDNGPPLRFIQDIQTIDGKLFITTTTHFLELDFERERYSILLQSEDITSEETATIFSAFIINKDGSFWVGSNNGLIHYNPISNQTKLYKQSTENRYSLPDNDILSLYRSRDGVLWIGTKVGLAKLESGKNRFEVLYNQPNNKNSISGNIIKDVIEDENNQLFIATTTGLNIYDRKTATNTRFFHDSEHLASLSSNYLLSLSLDKENKLWIGTKNAGLNELSLVENNLQLSSLKKHTLGNSSIQHIFDDGDVLWLGSSGDGLIRFEKNSGQVKYYPMNTDGTGPNHSHIFNIFKDSFGNYWLGTATGGINLFNPEKERFYYIRKAEQNPNSLANNLVLSIYEDSKKQLWFGTVAGLSKLIIPLESGLFEKMQKSENPDLMNLFQNYGRKNGFPNEVIYGILEDNAGKLWLSTNGGLLKFDPESERVEKVFTTLDGLLSNEHNQNAYFKNSKSEMFFGGAGGLSFFHPDSLKDNPFVPPVVITDIMLYNEPVPLKSYQNMNPDFELEKAPIYTQEVQLDYQHKVISFGFTALSYINTEENRYMYKMEGFDTDWLHAGENRLATYTNLDAGEYVFRVRASNNDGVWNHEGARLKLVIHPPWWKTNAAYFFYFIMFVTGIIGYVRFRISSATRSLRQKAEIEKARTEAREEFRKKIARDFHDEAGNKITKINLLVELVKRDNPNNVELGSYIESIEQNTATLASGMRDFIWTMDSDKDTLHDTVIRLQEFGEAIFSLTETRFLVSGVQAHFEEVILTMETRRTIMQIFKEAMNNCVKYAHANKVELVFMYKKNKRLEIRLTDNGVGIDFSRSAKFKGYGLKNMQQRAEMNNASLQILSEIGKGTGILYSMSLR